MPRRPDLCGGGGADIVTLVRLVVPPYRAIISEKPGSDCGSETILTPLAITHTQASTVAAMRPVPRFVHKIKRR